MKLAVLTQQANATRNARAIECTISDLQLKRIDHNTVNLNNTAQTVNEDGVTVPVPVFMDFVYQDDSVQRVWCSGNVSRDIRSRILKPESYGILVIVKATNKKGQAFWSVQYPDGERGLNTISIDGSLIGNKPVERKKVSWNDLATLGAEK